jgi:hypothetical protein
MKFHIKEMVLWPRASGFTPKRVPFAMNALNVISGVSRTGKSAVIPIIDYCLGAEVCSIPVNTIRDRCGWFGIVVKTERGEMLLARREPGAQRTTGDMYVLNGDAVEPPERIDSKNSSVDAVKRSLDELAGLSQLEFEPERPGSPFKGRPSFRDLVAFTFQPQNIVANQNILFFKADTHEHREKLRTVFPYVLGAISPDILAKQHELTQLRRDLSRMERELASLREVSARWVAEIRAWSSQARELGLIPLTVDINSPTSRLIDELRGATRGNEQEVRITTDSVESSISELVALQREESERATVIAQARRRLSEMEQLRATAAQYKDQLGVQRDRLKVAEWLGQIHTEDQSCPICGQLMQDEQHTLQPLLNTLSELERAAGEGSGIPAAFDRELQRVRNELRAATEQLDGVRHRIHALTRVSEAAKARQDATLQASRFVGRLEQALEHYERLGSDDGVAAEVANLRERVRELEAEVREGDIQRRTGLALKHVSGLIQKVMPALDAERPDDPVSLSVTDLTVRVAGRDREDALWEIGSGSNWLSYHLAVSLGLQQFFLELRNSPVPSFLVLDQPSQVYFPKQLSPAQSQGDAVPYGDEDVEAVRKIFTALASAVRNTGGRLQIIVLDHATHTVWGDVEPLNVAAEWRGGAKLVPEEWAVR